MPISRRISASPSTLFSRMTAEGLLRVVRVVEGERGRGVDGDGGEVVGDHVVQLPCHPGAFGGDGLGAVHLGQQRGLFGAQPGGLGGVAVVADDPAGGGGGERHDADDHADQQRLRRRATPRTGTSVPATVSSPVIHGMRRAEAGGPYSTAAYTRSVNITTVARLPWVTCPAVSAAVPTSRAVRGAVPAQQLAAGHHGERQQDRPAAVPEHDRLAGRPGAETEAPQQQPAEQPARRAMRTSSRCGRGSRTAMTPSNTGRAPARLIPREGSRTASNDVPRVRHRRRRTRPRPAGSLEG